MVTELKNTLVLKFHPDTLEYVRKELNLDKPGRIDEAVNLLEVSIQFLSEYLWRYEYNTGFIVIIDLRNVNILNFVSKCTPTEIRQMITLMTEGYGMRIKQIHIITPSKMIDAFLSLLKQVLSAKLGSRIHLHKSLDTLYDFVSKDEMPEEYGGKERSLKELNEEWIKAITDPEFIVYYENIIKAKTDESCRLANDFNEQYVGMPGSFRALSVD